MRFARTLRWSFEIFLVEIYLASGLIVWISIGDISKLCLLTIFLFFQSFRDFFENFWEYWCVILSSFWSILSDLRLLIELPFTESRMSSSSLNVILDSMLLLLTLGELEFSCCKVLSSQSCKFSTTSDMPIYCFSLSMMSMN